MLLHRLFSKIVRELYRLIHPALWGKRLQINGIPTITNPKNFMIGMDSSINADVFIQSSGSVQIGDRVTLSRGVRILTEGLDTTIYLENAKKKIREHIKKNVIIGNGTWIACGVTVCPGVEIAKNSIIAAGSVVIENITEEGFLYGGIPAKKIKKLT